MISQNKVLLEQLLDLSCEFLADLLECKDRGVFGDLPSADLAFFDEVKNALNILMAEEMEQLSQVIVIREEEDT